MILAPDIYDEIIFDGVRRGQPHEPVAQNTTLGWVIVGSIQPGAREHFDRAPRMINCSVIGRDGSLSRELSKFWELEETPLGHSSSPEDEVREKLFASEHWRLSSGRYWVPLPRRPSLTTDKLTDTLVLTRQALNAVNRRMSKNNMFRKQYEAFMRQYEEFGHMEKLEASEIHSQSHSVYIPHHAIWQHSDNGQKLQVVFDASRSSSGGESLNKLLYSGPPLQDNLLSVIIRWGRHKFVFCADIKMMYRQILVRAEDADLQRILW